MLLEINNEDTSASSSSVRFPDLQIFVEIFRTNLQSPACLEYGAAIKVPPKGHQHRITQKHISGSYLIFQNDPFKTPTN